MLHPSITFDKVTLNDNVSLVRVIRAVFDEYQAPKQGTVYSDPAINDLYELFKTPKSVLWVAKVDGEVVGCCGVYPTPNLPKTCAELVKFYLAAETRGKGIGKELMRRSILSAKEFGYNQLYLESIPAFSKAISIYQRLGFFMLDKPMGASGHNACNIWMLKELD
ncbi:MAG: GNAT family N-acetyltransferase [Aureispira sp.]|nr:GNAT family N-acetyltransferase [Aureispira sp.]